MNSQTAVATILIAAILGKMTQSLNVRDNGKRHHENPSMMPTSYRAPNLGDEPEFLASQYGRVTLSSKDFSQTTSATQQKDEALLHDPQWPYQLYFEDNRETGTNSDDILQLEINHLFDDQDDSPEQLAGLQSEDYSQTLFENEDDYVIPHAHPHISVNKNIVLSSNSRILLRGHPHKNSVEPFSKPQTYPRTFLTARDKVHRMNRKRKSSLDTLISHPHFTQQRRQRGFKSDAIDSSFVGSSTKRTVLKNERSHHSDLDKLVNSGILHSLQNVREKRSNADVKDLPTIGEDINTQLTHQDAIYPAVKKSTLKHMYSKIERHLRSIDTFLFETEEHEWYDFAISLLVLLFLTSKNMEEVTYKDFDAKVLKANDKGLTTLVKFSTVKKNNNFEMCFEMDDVPVVKTTCGSVFLQPGYRFQLYPNEMLCTWRFRSNEPSIFMSMNAGKQEESIHIHTWKHFTPYRATRDQVAEILHHEFSMTLKDGVPGELAFDICIPGTSDNLEEYKAFGGHAEEGFGKSNARCGEKRAASPPGAPFNEVVDPVYYGTFTWHALLIIHRSTTDTSQPPEYCSGALVSDLWVLTMASCFASVWDVTTDNSEKSRMPYVEVYFAVTEFHHIFIAKHFFAEEIVLHPALSSSHDIALVRLSEASPAFVPVCLPPFQHADLNKDIVHRFGQVVGWTFKNEPKRPRKLFLSNETFVGAVQCADAKREYLPRHVVCSGNSTRQDRCLVSSLLYDTRGGKYALRGLAFNRGGCDGSGLNVFTSVAHFVPWINAVVAGESGLPSAVSSTDESSLGGV